VKLLFLLKGKNPMQETLSFLKAVASYSIIRKNFISNALVINSQASQQSHQISLFPPTIISIQFTIIDTIVT